MDRHVRSKVLEDILALQENPRPEGSVKLSTAEKLFRIAVGPGKNYRAIYQIRDSVLVVLILKVGDRKDVYRFLN